MWLMVYLYYYCDPFQGGSVGRSVGTDSPLLVACGIASKGGRLVGCMLLLLLLLLLVAVGVGAGGATAGQQRLGAVCFWSLDFRFK